jgi:hypothetical protein
LEISLSKPVLERGKRPVFVMGCHRSGTNLLYDTLLSAGGFAVYRGYLPIYKILIPRFGSLNNLGNRENIISTWLRSKGFRRSGLDAHELTARVKNECKTGGDFIRVIMDEIAEKQNVHRWAVYDPDNVLHMAKVKADLPDALFVHIIRDGRDIALSLKKMGGFKPLPWDRESRSLAATALYWEWMVQNGRAYGRQIPADYIEIHYEDLVSNPHRALKTLGEFLDHDLDYDRIQSTGLGRLRESNSSFREEQGSPRPLNRWKERLSHQEIVSLEAMVGACLEEVGYPLSTPKVERQPGLREQWMRFLYFNFLDSKLWLKTNTPLGRLANMATLELLDPVQQGDAR